jgi:thioredoxin 1
MKHENRLRNLGLSVALAGLLLSAVPIATGDPGIDFSNLPVKGMVTMIDLGAKKCVPCKMMAPILEKLEKKYHGKAAIVFIDVWEHNEAAKRFGIRAIPTQIFFDADGREIYRHTGFMDEEKIVHFLTTLGVEA